MLDKIDKEIIRELQFSSKKTAQQMSRKLNIPRTTIHNRIKRLEKESFIKGYKAVIDAQKIDRGLTVLIGIITGKEIGSRELANKIRKYPQIEEIFIIAGQFDLIVKARLKDTNELASLIFDMENGLRGVHGITKTESMIVLETFKENGVIDPF